MTGQSAIHYLAVLAGIDEPVTQTTIAERSLLSSQLRGRKTIVEIGVFEGFTTKSLVDAADYDAVVYGVDPFFTGRLGISWGYRIARAYNKPALRDGRLQLVRSYSTEVGAQVPLNVDFVFIDGDHSLEGITADWHFWSGRIVPYGVIALHDSLVPTHNPRVARLGSHSYFEPTIRHDPRFEIVESVDSRAILRRVSAPFGDAPFHAFRGAFPRGSRRIGIGALGKASKVSVL